ncbi:MAG: metallophosphoesterase [Acidobacteriaceae bacterium]
MFILRCVVLAAIFGFQVGNSAAQGKAGPGPTFSVPDAALGKHVSVIVYGDMRFHDPANTTVANPVARKALVDRIAEEKPSAVQLTGDVPYKGADAADYKNYTLETAPWRAGGLRIYPALGNHEVSGGAAQGIENWWTAFPEIRGKRWYSVALGTRIYLIQLDSVSDLLDGSEQRAWLNDQLKGLPKTVDFVLIGLHHPPVADIQTQFHMDHNPRPNEIALRDYLTAIRPGIHAELLVTGGHIHNYERASVGGVTYLVSGGGGAHPYEVDRTPQDLYRDKDFPNFHYIRLDLKKHKLKAAMFRLADPSAAKPVWQEKDHFDLNKR